MQKGNCFVLVQAAASLILDLNVMLFKSFLSIFFGLGTTGGHHKPMFVQ